MRKIIAVTLALLFLVGGVSEAVNLNEDIIGDWFEVGRDGEIIGFLRFSKDGTVIKVEENSYEGSYKFIDDNRLEIKLRPIGAMVFDISIDKQEQLILTKPSGKVNRYITKTESEKKIKESFLSYDLTLLHKEKKLMWAKDANITDETMNWKDTSKFIENLNEQKYAGYSDWRLPSKEELETLLDFAKSRVYSLYTKKFNEFLNNIVGFKNVQDRYYWSSTPHADNKYVIWVLRTDIGSMGAFRMDGAGYVLPVRAGQ